MKKSVVAGVLIIIVLGFFSYFFDPFASNDPRYDSPDQVQNRSEVEKELLKRFSKSKRVQAASLEYARQFQVAISFPELARETYIKFDKASSCFAALYGDDNKGAWREIEAMVINTYKRSSAYLKYNGNLSGYMYTVYPHSVNDCHFDVNSLEN